MIGKNIYEPGFVELPLNPTQSPRNRVSPDLSSEKLRMINQTPLRQRLSPNAMNGPIRSFMTRLNESHEIPNLTHDFPSPKHYSSTKNLLSKVELKPIDLNSTKSYRKLETTVRPRKPTLKALLEISTTPKRLVREKREFSGDDSPTFLPNISMFLNQKEHQSPVAHQLKKPNVVYKQRTPLQGRGGITPARLNPNLKYKNICDYSFNHQQKSFRQASPQNMRNNTSEGGSNELLNLQESYGSQILDQISEISKVVGSKIIKESIKNKSGFPSITKKKNEESLPKLNAVLPDPVQMNRQSKLRKKLRDHVDKIEENVIEVYENLSKDAAGLNIFNTFNNSRITLARDPSEKVPQKNWKIIRKKLLETLNSLKRMKLTPRIVINEPVFTAEPYGRADSQRLFQAIKAGNIKVVKKLLAKNRYLIHDFDNIHQKPLHWAARYEKLAIVKLLLDAGADIDAKDLIGRTPIYFALCGNNVEVVKYLFRMKCNPWSSGTGDYMDFVKDKPSFRSLLSRSRQLHIVEKFLEPSEREEFWRVSALDYFL